MGRNCNCAFEILEFAFKIVEGAFKIVEGAFEILEGAFANDEIPFIKGVVTVTGTFFDFITVEIRSLYIPVLFAGGWILYLTGSIWSPGCLEKKVRSLGSDIAKAFKSIPSSNFILIVIVL
jgi:hypothetical protein